MFRARILTALLTAVFVVSCGGGSTPQNATGSGPIIKAEKLSESDPGVPADAASVHRITYKSRSGVDDSNTYVTGSVYVPRSAAPQGGYHIVAYGQALNSASPNCQSPQPAATSAADINTLLKAGYVVAVPDYQGLGDPADGKRLYHPSLDSTTGGYNMLDAVRATSKLIPDASPIWAAVGQGQGGQAAWALNELSDNYGFQHLRGSVSISPIADFSGLADAAAQGKLTGEQRRLYIAYLAALQTEYKTQFPLDDYRRGVAKEKWDLLSNCNPGDDAARNAVIAQIGPDDLRPASPEALAALRRYLDKTTLPQGPAQAPMLVMYGDRDPLIPAAWTERAIAAACAMNDRITVRESPSPSLNAEVMDWIARRVREEPVADDCAAFVAAHPLPPSAAAPKPKPVAAPVVRPAESSGAGQQAAANDGISLIDGWLPVTIQVLAAGALIAATGWRSRRWRLRMLPIAAAAGAVSIAVAWWFVTSQGWGSVYPWGMWVWIGLTGLGVVVAVLGWPGSAWWRRALSVLAVPLCFLSAGTVLNASLGYLPTVTTAWQRATGQLPPQWIDQAKLAEMQRDGIKPTRGTVVRFTTPSDISGFSHREELVYLPPVWFTSSPPPELPAVMMIGAELSSPSDWLQSGRALDILDNFALAHHGATPVMVFPDTSGSFTNDTECVNGPRGNAADHLIQEFVPYVTSTFGLSSKASSWGLAGWSSGGTCSLTLAVSHPDKFSAIVDLDGQLGPNAGKKPQTIARLFGGDANAWAAFDPKTIVETNRYYYDMAAWVGVSDKIETRHWPADAGAGHTDELHDWDTYSEDHAKTGNQLCILLSAHGIECSVVGYSGGHDFPSASFGFKDALPWLAGWLNTPGVPRIALPGD